MLSHRTAESLEIRKKRGIGSSIPIWPNNLTLAMCCLIKSWSILKWKERKKDQIKIKLNALQRKENQSLKSCEIFLSVGKIDWTAWQRLWEHFVPFKCNSVILTAEIQHRNSLSHKMTIMLHSKKKFTNKFYHNHVLPKQPLFLLSSQFFIQILTDGSHLKIGFQILSHIHTSPTKWPANKMQQSTRTSKRYSHYKNLVNF